MAAVAQVADQLGRQRAVQQRDDVLAPRAVARRHSALLQAALGRLKRAFGELQALGAGFGCGHRGGGLGVEEAHRLLFPEIALAPSSANSSTATKSTRKTTKR